MAKLKIIISITLIILTLILISQNTQVVETKIFFASVSMPRAALLSITLLIGIVIGLFIALSKTKKED